MAQLMPLPLTVSCFSKIQIGFTFLAPAYPGSPGNRAVKRVCVCVRVGGWSNPPRQEIGKNRRSYVSLLYFRRVEDAADGQISRRRRAGG